MSTIKCDQTYQVTIGSVPVTAYWTLDEVPGTTNRNDSVGFTPLVPTGVTEPGVPGLISNGVEMSGAFGGGDYNGSSAHITYTTGDSFSAWGWVRVNAIGPADATGGPRFEVFFNFFVRGIALAAGSSFDPTPFKIQTNSDTAFVVLTLGAWHFFHLFYDATSQKLGYSFDNGAETLLPTVIVFPTLAPIIELQQHYVGAPGVTIFDEIGLLINSKLTAAQVAYLYNGGAGRTWPISL